MVANTVSLPGGLVTAVYVVAVGLPAAIGVLVDTSASTTPPTPTVTIALATPPRAIS